MRREGWEWALIDSHMNLEEVSAPTLVGTDTIKLYAKDKSGVSSLYFMDDALGEHDLGIIPSASFTSGSVIFGGSTGLLAEDNANFFFDDTNDRLGIGLNSSLLSKLHISSSAVSPDAIVHVDNYTTTPNAGIRGRTARGSKASPTASQLDDVLVSLTGIGYGSSFGGGADVGIFGRAAETFVSTTNKGSYLTFETTPIGSATRAEVARISAAGFLGIGNTSPLTAVDIAGASAATATLSIERRGAGFAAFSGYRINGAPAADQGMTFFGGGGSHDGTSANRAVTSLFGVYAAETWAVGAKGSYLTLETTPLLSTTRAERFRVGPSGQWGIGGATYGSVGDVLTSGGASAPPTWTIPSSGMSQAQVLARISMGG